MRIFYRGKKIEEVADMSDYQPINHKDRVLDVKKAWVMPGLIESSKMIYNENKSVQGEKNEKKGI